MKVLEKGTIEPHWKERVICTGRGNGGAGCGANLEVYFEDVYTTRSYCYDGSSDKYSTIMCVVCKVETDIKGPNQTVPYKDIWMKKKRIHVPNQ